MQSFEFYLDLIPVVLAIGVLFNIGTAGQLVATNMSRLTNYLISIACVVLIIAQTSWSFSSHFQHNLNGTWFANLLWFAFDTLCMIIFSMIASRR